MTTITAKDLEGALTHHTRHGNMGYADDGRHKGYTYEHRFEKYPRLGFRDIHHTLDDGGWSRVWMVDGADAADLDAALKALDTPPVINAEEAETLKKIPRVFVKFQLAWDLIAGVPHPEGAIMPNTPHSRVLRLLTLLGDKGLVEFGKKTIEASPEAKKLGIEEMTDTTIRRHDDRPFTIKE
jgi:hypothetical protein